MSDFQFPELLKSKSWMRSSQPNGNKVGSDSTSRLPFGHGPLNPTPITDSCSPQRELIQVIELVYNGLISNTSNVVLYAYVQQHEIQECRASCVEYYKYSKTINHSVISYLICIGEEISMGQAGLATILDIEDHQPFLVSFLKSSDTPRQAHPPKPPRRVPRSAGGNSREGGGKRNRKTKKGRNFDFAELLDRPRSCQMGMLYVNFEDLGWKDWVIAPDGFIAYYCTGECSFPLTASMNATNHAIVSTLVHTYYPLEYPKPSCAPVKLGSISMLYYDDNSNVTVKKYKDMVIKSCGCK